MKITKMQSVIGSKRVCQLASNNLKPDPTGSETQAHVLLSAIILESRGSTFLFHDLCGPRGSLS